MTAPVNSSNGEICLSSNDEIENSVHASSASQNNESAIVTGDIDRMEVSSNKLSAVDVNEEAVINKSSSKPIQTNTNSEKNPLQVFNEYVANLFQKAEVYEQELERRQSKINLETSLDHVRHGTIRNDSMEEDIKPNQRGNGDTVNETESSPMLSPTSEAVAVVEAMSSFRSFTDVKRAVSFRSESELEGQSSTSQKPDQATTIDSCVDSEADQGDKENWNTFCEVKKQNNFAEVAVDDISLSLTLDEFYDLVLKDDASNSIGKFMTRNGDFDVETTQWEPVDGKPMTRTIHYTHPVNVPMAPPTAKAFKTQYLHRFGLFGLCLESSTIVEDVPMTDCFVVDDRLWVQQNETGGCTVRVTFQIRFVKTTMFRRIIENATRSEFEKWWRLFGEMIVALQGPSDEDDFELVAQELEEITQMFEGECVGQEVQLTDAMKKIRSSSKRLSIVAKRASMRQVNTAAPKNGNNATDIAKAAYQCIVSFIQSTISHFKDNRQPNNNILGGLAVLFVIGVVNNLWIYHQLFVANKTLSSLDANIKHLSDMNEILLSKLEQSATCS